MLTYSSLNSPISKCEFIPLHLSRGTGGANQLYPTKLIARDNQLQIYQNDLIKVISLPGEIINFSIHASSLTIRVFTSKCLEIFDIYDFELVESIGMPESIRCGFCVDDNNANEKIFVYSKEGNVYSHDRSSSENKWKLLFSGKSDIGRMKMHDSVLFGSVLVFWDKINVKLLDLTKKQIIHTIECFKARAKGKEGGDRFTCMACNDKYLSVGSSRGKIFIYDSQTMKYMQTIHWHYNRVSALAIDGNTVFSGGLENTLVVYNLITHEKSLIYRLIPAALNSFKENAQEYPIVCLRKCEEFVAVSFESQVITVNLASSQKVGSDVDFIRFKEDGRFEYFVNDTVDGDQDLAGGGDLLVTSDGFNINWFSNVLHGGYQGKLIRQLQHPHTLFCRLPGGNIALYNDKQLFFYQKCSSPNVESDMILNTVLHVNSPITQLIPVQLDNDCALISINEYGTFSLFSTVMFERPASQIIGELLESGEEEQNKRVNKYKKKKEVYNEEQAAVFNTLIWKLILVNEFRGLAIINAKVEDDLLFLQHEDQISIWDVSTFEFMGCKDYPDGVESMAINKNFLAVVTKQQELIVEDLLGDSSVENLNSFAYTKTAIPTNSRVNCLAPCRHKPNNSSNLRFLKFIMITTKNTKTTTSKQHHDEKKRKCEIFAITNKNAKSLGEVESSCGELNCCVYDGESDIIASSQTKLLRISLLESTETKKKSKQKPTTTTTTTTVSPAKMNITDPIGTGLFDLSESHAADIAETIGNIAVGSTDDSTLDLFNGIPCHLMDISLMFNTFMKTKLSPIKPAAVNSSNNGNTLQDDDGMDVDNGKLKIQVEEKYAKCKSEKSGLESIMKDLNDLVMCL